jgi:CRISPR-associated endonuclease/helicase Cas3
MQELTGYSPLPWHDRLYKRLLEGNIPGALDVATGLAKTSVVPIWLLAMAATGGARLPRRLVYVVNRRTVVDQTTDIAERLRDVLAEAKPGGCAAEVREALSRLCLDPADEASPLAISTLRGEHADNAEWLADPGRAAIIVGTVDMIGSRLLLAGYGVSNKARPFHAGLLGQDALYIHDEAHLTPAFGALLADVAARQRDSLRPIRVLELTATQRTDGPAALTLDAADYRHVIVRERVGASKRLVVVDGDISTIIERALSYVDARVRVLVYVWRPDDARDVAHALVQHVGEDRVRLLTGTIRGYERDQLVETSPLFAGFRASANRARPEATEYLVATSAGEVGIDLDGDHLVCDLVTLDSMIQRLGRVNRLGESRANVHIVAMPPTGKRQLANIEARIAATGVALGSLPNGDASPMALGRLVHTLREEGRLEECFSRPPRQEPLTDILVDAWAQTTLRDLPGRLNPATWLHGHQAEPPEIYVAWREEVAHLGSLNPEQVEELYECYPILARERLRMPLYRAIGALDDLSDEMRGLSKGASNLPAVLLPVFGLPLVGDLDDVLREAKRDGNLDYATLVLPCEAGGLDARGILEPSSRDRVTDVSETDERRRILVRLENGEWVAESLDLQSDSLRKLRRAVANAMSMWVRLTVPVECDEDGEPAVAYLFLARRPEVGDEAVRPQTLAEHTEWVSTDAQSIVRGLGLDAALAEAIVLAAQWHDKGKDRRQWQLKIGNRDFSKPLAKSGGKDGVAGAGGEYRHEFGSLRDAERDPFIATHPERDLILHLIAAHHGYGRPHFRPEQWDFAPRAECAVTAIAAANRFDRLQRRFGHWGLAWLETLLRAADHHASGRL